MLVQVTTTGHTVLALFHQSKIITNYIRYFIIGRSKIKEV